MKEYGVLVLMKKAEAMEDTVPVTSQQNTALTPVGAIPFTHA